MSVHRINRVLRLITLLHAGQAGSPGEMAKQLGVTRRTLFRDLNMLKAAGIPHHFLEGQGYRIGKSDFLPPVNLSVLETLGLLVLGKTAAAQPRRPMMTAALSAINKLVLTMPAELREACADVVSHITVDVGGQVESDRESKCYAVLQRCIDEGRSCEMIYGSPTEATPLTCRLDPYALHFAARAWYVLGKTDLHREVRIFKLSRIATLRELPHRFRRPRRFRVEQKIGKAWQLIPEGKVYKVTLEFTKRVAMNVAEVRWHPTQRTRFEADGRLRVDFEIDGLREIAWWICGYADQVKVLRPPALAEQVRQMHAAAAARYEAK